MTTPPAGDEPRAPSRYENPAPWNSTPGAPGRPGVPQPSAWPGPPPQQPAAWPGGPVPADGGGPGGRPGGLAPARRSGAARWWAEQSAMRPGLESAIGAAVLVGFVVVSQALWIVAFSAGVWDVGIAFSVLAVFRFVVALATAALGVLAVVRSRGRSQLGFVGAAAGLWAVGLQLASWLSSVVMMVIGG